MASSTPQSSASQPATSIESAVAPNGQPYYIDHTSQTTSWHQPAPGPPLPSAYTRAVDAKGRTYYLNHDDKTTSYLNPVTLASLRAQGIVAAEPNGKARPQDEGTEDRMPWIVEEMMAAPNEGEKYYVDYRNGCLRNQSPEDLKEAKERLRKKKEQQEKNEERL